MTAPYREQPRFLLCPRCGEMLDRVFDGASACPRCEGVWLATVTLDTAFGNPQWPVGQAMWWRNELECPECALDATRTTMDAKAAENVVVDRCPAHGLWLDRGELGRLIGAPNDELGELQARVTQISPDPAQLAHRREVWRSELDARRKAASEFRAWVERERRRKEAEATAHEAAAPAPPREPAAPRTSTPSRATSEPPRMPAPSAPPREEPVAAAAQRNRSRAAAMADVRVLEDKASALRGELYRVQAELELARERVRRLGVSE